MIAGNNFNKRPIPKGMGLLRYAELLLGDLDSDCRRIAFTFFPMASFLRACRGSFMRMRPASFCHF